MRPERYSIKKALIKRQILVTLKHGSAQNVVRPSKLNLLNAGNAGQAARRNKNGRIYKGENKDALEPGQNDHLHFFEEKGSEERFGDDCPAYKSPVPRWIPRLRAWNQGSDGQ